MLIFIYIYCKEGDVDLKQSYYPKVLVISHNVFSKTSNMGKTMTQFFGKWEGANLAQLFFYNEIPNVDICSRYCRITDFDMLKSIFNYKTNATYMSNDDINLNIKDTRTNKGLKSNIYQFGRKKKPYMYLVRNILWCNKKWKTKGLMNWIEEFNPDVIFYPAGGFSFSMKIVIDVCKERNLPLVTFFGDEYYFLKSNNKSLLDRINKKEYRKTFNELMKYTSFYITASDKMYEVYQNEFGGCGAALLTPSLKCINSFGNKDMKISYIGNLGFDRWKALIDISRILKKEGYVLDVYSSEIRESVLKNFTIDNGIRFNGSISAEEVQQTISQSKLLIYVESMDEVNKEKTRYSMSTKISESLNSGVCIFAYGPSDIASIEYLKSNNAACVVTNDEDLERYLLKVLKDEKLREKYIENALKLAEQRHSYETNTTKFYEVIKYVVKNYKVGH